MSPKELSYIEDALGLMEAAENYAKTIAIMKAITE